MSEAAITKLLPSLCLTLSLKRLDSKEIVVLRRWEVDKNVWFDQQS